MPLLAVRWLTTQRIRRRSVSARQLLWPPPGRTFRAAQRLRRCGPVPGQARDRRITHPADATLYALPHDESSLGMTVTLCVLLWARAAHESDVIAYEDQLLQLLPDHGGQVLERARTRGAADEPLECSSCGSFGGCPRRAHARPAAGGACHKRETAIARTQALRVELV